MTAVDFSFTVPSVAELEVAQVVAVGRYLTGAGKSILPVEFEDYMTAGIGVWFVFEDGADDADGGAGMGAANALAANDALVALGLPTSCPVYFAADKEYAPGAEPVGYWQGIATVRPRLTNGAYGQGSLLTRLQSMGLIGFGWQSDSDSFPGSGPVAVGAANLHQRPTGAPLYGTDLDLILTPDFGQWPRPGLTPTPPEEDENMTSIEYAGQMHVFWTNPATGVCSHWWQQSGVPGWHSELLPAP